MPELSTILLLLVCLAVSFLLSGMEAGVFTLNRLRIRQYMRAGHPRARVLHSYLDDPEDFLWTILVGNTVANLAAVVILVNTLYDALERWPVLFWLALLLCLFLFYVLCDLLPKMLFRTFPNRLSLFMVMPFRFIRALLRPLVGMVAWLSQGLLRWTGGKVFTGHLFGNREELRHVMQESGEGLTSEERQMINRVMDLQNVAVRQITLPLSQVLAVETTTPVAELRSIFRECQHEFLPVWRTEANHRRIIGVVALRQLLSLGDTPNVRTAGDLLRPALYLDEKLRWENALRLMRRSGHRLAIVLGPDRKEMGIVTMQDLLKALFGEVSI